jgi:hypothetical protein
LEAVAKQLPLGGHTRRSDDWNNAKLLPELSDGAQYGGFADFPAKKMLQIGNGRIAGFKMLVSLHCQWRNLAGAGELRAAAPVAITPQCIHIGQNPACYNKVGLFTGLSKQVQPDGHIFELKTHKQFFSQLNMLCLGGCILTACYGLYKRRRDRGRKLPPG